MITTIVENLYFLNIFITFIAIVEIIISNKQSESAIAWILIILVFPLIGIGLYILIGVDWRKWKRFKLVSQLPEDFFEAHLSKVLNQQKKLINESELKDDESMQDVLKNVNLLLYSNQEPLTLDNQVKVYYSGEEHFRDLQNDLRNSETSIHMEYFIWRSDKLGEEIKEILIERALNGVEVKLIFDGLGSFGRISFKYRRELRKAGIEFSYFLDLNRLIARLKINYSNHKKIVVIDGRIAYTGGMNIGDEYITGGRWFDSWRDTHVRLNGGSTAILQTIFLADWFNCKKEMLIKDDFYPIQDEEISGIPIQIAVSGPDSKWGSIELLYFNMITNAKHEILIQSPYFIPDDAILKAMESAALCGVDVTLMMTGVADKKIPWWSAFTYFEPLLEAGVKILHYNTGFLHSKVIVMDNMVATVGTCNMDIRSFKLNYEVNTVFYDKELSKQLNNQFKEDMRNCREVTLKEIQSLSLFKQFRNSFCRIFSPLM